MKNKQYSLSPFATTFRKEQLEEWDPELWGRPHIHKDGLLRYENKVFIPQSRVRWLLQTLHRAPSGHLKAEK